MATALVNAFLDAKLKDAKTSIALYSVSSDVDGAKISQEVYLRSHQSIVEMLQTSCQPLDRDPKMVASMLQGTLTGISRRVLEGGVPDSQLASMRQEVIFLACSYVDACLTPIPTP